MVPAVKPFRDAVWRRNAAWVQGLGLCPLFAVTASVGNAAGLALASGCVLIGSAVVVSALRTMVPGAVRLPCLVLVIATFTTSAAMLMEAFAFDLYARIALFAQLVVTNCMILGRMEQFASRQPPLPAALDAAGTAVGFAVALLALGAAREALAHGVPLAALAPGAFIVAGLMLAMGRALAGAGNAES